MIKEVGTIITNFSFGLTSDWQWLINTFIGFAGLIVGAIGARLSYKAFKYSMQANQDIHELIKDELTSAIKSSNKEDIRNRLIETGLSEFRLKGEPDSFLRFKYHDLVPTIFDDEEFNKIREEIFWQHKHKKPKRPLFDKSD